MNATLPLHAASCYESSNNDSSNNTLLKQPLLEEESSLPQSPSSEDNTSASGHDFRPSSCFYGVLAGFLVQAITLGAYIAMISEFGEDAPSSRSFLYLFLKCLSQIDVCLYAIVWVTFTMSMTQCGMRLLKHRCFGFESRKSIFHMGVNCLVGIVLGSFAALTVINVLLRLPVPFLPIAGTVFGDLALCYLMVMCYDWGEDNIIKEEETVEEDATYCC